MERLLEAWKKTGDSWSYNWHEPVEDRGRLHRHRAFYTLAEYRAWAKENPEAEKQ
jgi:hypothetical protein